MAAAAPPAADVPAARLLAAFAAIYVLWGSTFLAIRFGLESFPPFLLMALRSLCAGALLYAGARLGGAERPAPALWRSAFVAGAMLFLVCHGGLAYGQQTVPSGVAAVLSATIPLWMVPLDSLTVSRRRPGLPVSLGIALGFLGVALLVRPPIGAGAAPIDPLGATIILIGALSWAGGSLYGRQASRPASVPLATAMQLLAGGALLLVVSGLSGEWAAFADRTVTLRSVLSLAYLVVFGSIVAFTAFIWLMAVSTPAKVSTYAYINPLVALALGVLFADETITRSTLLSGAVILVGVALVVSGGRRQRRLQGAVGGPS